MFQALTWALFFRWVGPTTNQFKHLRKIQILMGRSKKTHGITCQALRVEISWSGTATSMDSVWIGLEGLEGPVWLVAFSEL